MLQPKQKILESRRPLVPTPAHVRGHLTDEGSVVEPYESHRNRLPVTSREPRYRNFDDLALNEPSSSYQIDVREGSGYGIFGIHGGKISDVVSHLTDTIAGNDFTKYHFKGTKSRGNGDLVLSGHQFNEPSAVRLANHVPVVLSLAISDKRDNIVLIDGRNEFLCDELTDSLNSAGFKVHKPFRSHLNGRKRTNIANKGSSGMGVQIQLPKDLRMQMTQELENGTANNPDSLTSKFGHVVRGVLDRVSPEESVSRTKAQLRDSGRVRNDDLYIGEFSDLTSDKKVKVAQKLIDTNRLFGMTPEAMAGRLNRNTVFVAYDKANDMMKSVAGVKRMKAKIQKRILDVYNGHSEGPRDGLLVSSRELSEFIGNVEKGHAVEWGWTSNPSGDRDAYKKILTMLTQDAHKKGFGVNSIFGLVRTSNPDGLRHAESLGLKPAMKFSSPFTGSENDLILFVYKGRRR